MLEKRFDDNGLPSNKLGFWTGQQHFRKEIDFSLFKTYFRVSAYADTSDSIRMRIVSGRGRGLSAHDTHDLDCQVEVSIKAPTLASVGWDNGILYLLAD